jgi:hypothetical protein
MHPESPRGLRVGRALARQKGNDRPVGRATRFLVASVKCSRLALPASAALFMSGCDPIEKAGWFGYFAGFVVALAVWVVTRQLAGTRDAARKAREVSDASADAADRRWSEFAGNPDLQRCFELADECDRMLGRDWYRPSPVGRADLVALQHFGAGIDWKWVVVAACLLVTPAVSQAQLTPWQRQVKVARDSVLCTGSASARQKRACKRLDSLVVTPVAVARVVATPAPAPSYAARLYYDSPTMYMPPDGASVVTVCAVIEDAAGVRWIAWPPLRVTLVGADSVSFVGNEAFNCSFALAAERLDTAPGRTVVWSLVRFTLNGREVWRPFPSVP